MAERAASTLPTRQRDRTPLERTSLQRPADTSAGNHASNCRLARPNAVLLFGKRDVSPAVCFHKT